ncbi:MAG: ABC transporter permease [Phycisphaerales bacterium JB063]
MERTLSIATPNPATTATTVIRPTRGLERLGLGALLAHRDLLLMLALRDIKVRYKQAVLGVAWAVLQPVALAGILWLFFGVLLGMDQKVAPTPYLVFVLAGVLPWTLFESAVTASSNSVVANAGIVRKVYFPRLIIPLAAAGAPLVDYVLGLLVLLAAMLLLGVAFSWQLALLPILVMSTLIAVMGVGILLSALTVAYRDFRHIVPFLLRLLFFMTPVIYPVAVMPERFRWLLALNPVGGTISAFRAAVLGQPIDATAWALSTLTGCICLGVGLVYFQRAQRRFADIV